MNDDMNAEGRAALAAEIENLRDGLLGVANTRYLDRPVFGGNQHAPLTPTTPPPAATQGDGGHRPADRAAPASQVPVNVTGDAVFGAERRARPALRGAGRARRRAARRRRRRARPAATPASVALDKGIDRVIGQLGDIGARTNRLDDA